MDERDASALKAHVELLELLASRIRADDVPPRLELEAALERGFGRLIGLEAQLQNSRRAESAADPGSSQVPELERSIAVLSEKLTELRTLSSSPGSSRVGYGFVLPDRRRGPAPQRRSDRQSP